MQQELLRQLQALGCIMDLQPANHVGLVTHPRQTINGGGLKLLEEHHLILNGHFWD